MNKEHRPSRLFKAVGILLCLVLVSAHFTTGLYARYTTSARGSDAARAAKLSVKISDAQETQAPSESGIGKYEVTVTNDSEVAVSCLVQLDFVKTIVIDEASFAVDGGDTSKLTIGDTTKNTVGGNIQMAPNSTATLVFTLTFDQASLTNTLTVTNTTTNSNDDISTASGAVNFDVIATFTQID